MKRLVLAGAGHAHAQVLLDWARDPLPGVELVVVSPQALAPYSGMVPGWLAGIYRFEEIVVDFPALCAAAGARWVAAEVDVLAAPRRCLRLSSGEEIGYDVLSFNIGSTLRPPDGAGATVLPLRPLSQLRSGYEAMLERWTHATTDRPLTVTAIGGGAAGFEALLAVLARLRGLRPDGAVHGSLVTRGTVLLPGLSMLARRAAERALARAGVTVQLGSGWCAALGRSSDIVLWATGAEPHDWQRDPARRGSLAVDDAGFIRIDPCLRSVSHAQVFAVGDCAHWDAGAVALPKAGVYAVRMGPVLARNLRAALGKGDFTPYRPQRDFLVLLSTGDERAIASRGPFGAAGAWAWHWKDRIDRRFLHRFAITADMPRRAAPQPAPSNSTGDSA